MEGKKKKRDHLLASCSRPDASIWTQTSRSTPSSRIPPPPQVISHSERERVAPWVLFPVTKVTLGIQAKCKILPGKKHSTGRRQAVTVERIPGSWFAVALRAKRMERLVKEEDGANFSLITFVAPAVCGHHLFALGQKYLFFLSSLTWFFPTAEETSFPGRFFFSHIPKTESCEIQ